MKILYDSQIFNQGTGGASRYYVELIDRLASQPDVDVDLALKYSGNVYLQGSKFGQGKYGLPEGHADINKFLGGRNFRGKGKLFKAYSKLSSAAGQKQTDIWGENHAENLRKLEAHNFDIFHPTYYDPYFLKHIGSKPFVFTILDMNHEIYSEFFQTKDMLAISERKAALAAKAAHVIAISEKTKSDAVDILGLDPEKVTVVHLASSIKDVAPKTEHKFPNKFVLYVGHRWIYKNFLMFFRALAPLMQQDPDLHLVCIGGGSFDEKERGLFDQTGLADKIVRIDADEPTLVYAFQNARAFVYPSQYEGFGVPIIEAFESGCPVALSNASCFPEVAGDAGVYFEPKDFLSIKEALRQVIYDEQVRERVIAAGYERAKQFSWDKMAAQTLAVYQKVLS